MPQRAAVQRRAKTGSKLLVPSCYTFRVFGLNVRSDIPLHELPASEIAGAVDVTVKCGSVPQPDDERVGYLQLEQGTVLNVPDVGRYLISGGRQITLDPAATASERNVRLYLLGSAFGALLHQRGIVPLHANAIDIGGRAVAFSGHSGAGKSTIAAWFHDRSYRILADDVCAIQFGEDDRPLAYPGIPRLRLWRDALEARGRVAEDYARSFGEAEKYDVPTGSDETPAPLPLARIYMLVQAEERSATVRRLRGAAAVNALVSNTYRGAYVNTINRTADHLMQCVRIAQKVPIYEVQRVWGFDVLEQQARLIEGHALSA